MPTNLPEPSADGLQAVWEKTQEIWPDIEKEYSVAMLMGWSDKEKISLMIRSYGDIERELSPEDVEEIRQSLFESIGDEFPVDIAVKACCKGEPMLVGKIERVDPDTNRVLIVSETKRNGNTDDPEAHWVGLTPDGQAILNGGEPTNVFGDEYLGKKAQAWTTGMVDQSYPGQTAAIKLVAE